MKKIWNIGWGYVSQCNMNCEFCYSKEVREPLSKLNLDICKQFINRNSESISSINFGTGENSLSDDWFRLVKYIGENHPHIEIALTTNGNIYNACHDKEKLQIFKNFIKEVDVSLDFIDKDRHNKFRGNSQAYDMAINALCLCKEYGKQATLVFLGTNEVVEVSNLEGIFGVADKYDAFLRSNIYRPTVGFRDEKNKFILGFSNLIRALKWISDNHKIIKVSDCLFAAVLFNRKEKDHTGESSIRILGDGSVTPSTYLIGKKYRKYNIQDNVFLDRINFDEQIDRNWIPKACNGCKFISKCKGGVLDRRLLWYGTLEERDPYCPLRYKNISISNNIKLSNDNNFSSVHDGYLPTMFFSS